MTCHFKFAIYNTNSSEFILLVLVVIIVETLSHNRMILEEFLGQIFFTNKSLVIWWRK